MDLLHDAPLRTVALLRFRVLSALDREVYSDTTDPDALIAYTDMHTWIIEGDMLRVIEVDQEQLRARQQYFALEQLEDASLLTG